MKKVTKKKAATKKTIKPEFLYLDKLTATGRFFKRPDGWVRDNLLGLDWGPSSFEYMTFENAQEYCQKLGGRLPELRELHSLVDYKQYDPAINADLFTDTKSSWYWTGTEHKKYAGSAWGVGFYNGYVGIGNKGNDGYVRPCRASQ